MLKYFHSRLLQLVNELRTQLYHNGGIGEETHKRNPGEPGFVGARNGSGLEELCQSFPNRSR
jgi:hypothetical protein